LNKKQELDFYFDFTSPYAYNAALQIDGLAAKHDYSVRWHPFLVGAALSVTGRAPSLETPVVDQYVLNDMQRSAREHKLQCVQPENFPILAVKPA
jgi:2-hydroxychromene-2-carboxylate isomerase